MESKQISGELKASLEELLQDLLSRKDIPHVFLGIMNSDKSLQWHGAAGDVKPNIPYFIASIDKLFAATSILKLYERGKITLDEPMISYIPESLINGIHHFGGIDYTGKITIRHLLSHTSGLADWLEDRPKGGRSLVEQIVRNGDMSLSMQDMLNVIRKQMSPYFPPQDVEDKKQKVRYCDTNFILLIAIIEAITGQSLSEVYNEYFFRPLNMRQTWLVGRSKPIDEAPEPAALWFGKKPLYIRKFLRSSWSIYSTSKDTLIFLYALVHGKIFEDRTTFALMQSNWNRFGVPFDRAALRSPSWPIEYGLGIMRFHDPILKLVGRLPRVIRPIYPAPAVIGHTGSTGSWLFYCPVLDLFLSGTVDQASAGAIPFRLVPKILRLVDRMRE